MSNDLIGSGLSFKQCELSGWDAKAQYYDEHAGEITQKAVPLLLQEAAVKPGSVLLDVACGPGYIAGNATKQGVVATGVDFAPGMVAEAQKNFPTTDFYQGDAEALAFEDQHFDSVVCSFGLLHLAHPEKAVAEAYRILKPGGRYVFTVWAREKHDFFTLVLNAIETHGNMDVSLPQGPSIFRFSDYTECQNLLTQSGFSDVEIKELPLHWAPTSVEDLLGFLEKSSVRTAMLLEQQTSEARKRIYQAIRDGALEFKQGNAYRLEWPAVMAVAKK